MDRRIAINCTACEKQKRLCVTLSSLQVYFHLYHQMHICASVCRYAVRKVVFSPHAETILASCSYDMTVRLWDIAAPEDSQLRVWDHHTEFAVGLDFSSLSEGMLASTGWDEMTYFWNQRENAR